MARDQGPPSPYRFDFLPAPGELSALCNSFYFFESSQERLEDVLPAYSGQILLVLSGRLTLQCKDGSQPNLSDCGVLAPLLEAHEFVVEGPACVFGISLNFRGWAAIAGLPVDECANQVLGLEDVLPAKAAKQLARLAADARDETIERRELPGLVTPILLEAAQELRERDRQLIDTTLDWLSASFRPEVADLYARFEISARQVQRLVSRFFGVSPKHLARRYRAVRAGTILAMPEIAPGMESQVREAFYDQAHMIKEIRHFTGRTPKRLVPAKGDDMVRDSLGKDGYSAVDPFGGSEAEQLGKKPG